MLVSCCQHSYPRLWCAIFCRFNGDRRGMHDGGIGLTHYKKQKQLLVAQVVCTRGICTPLRPAIPPLKAPLGFACSVASLSRSPGHHRPGHHSFRHVAPVECHLGWDKPSTCRAARSTVPNTAAATPHTGDREP